MTEYDIRNHGSWNERAPGRAEEIGAEPAFLDGEIILDVAEQSWFR